ncbi:histone-lysine N-methyltransferase 2D-like [Vitis riparia]|uniref:histone-lysine N-methyltransferase 2D-like n=1 Tax=Vitis riparia TaxID=96939 RepID=UPI00155A2F49|nr:histone-lysine N-methyltransferase 2D-like [Vitis riparia]
MSKTRGAKSSSPSTSLRVPRETLVQAAISESPRPLVVPPPIEDAPMSPPSRRYQTRRSLTMAKASSSRAKKSSSGPPKKKAKVSEPIDLTEPESEPRPSQPPVKKPQPSQPPAKATPRTPPVIPPISESSPLSEPRIAISIIEYRGLCHTFQALAISQSILTQQITALSAHQEQIIATQTQHTAILRQIQHHLGILSTPEHLIPIPPEPSQAPSFVHQIMPPKEPTTGEAEASALSIQASAAEPSSSHHPPATI